jgi:hypothetical protein
MVSHELRTPVTVVLGMAQTLVGRPDMAATADGQEIRQRVVRQGKRLRDMVEQLLQASAFVANRSPVLQAEGVRAAEVVAEVVQDWKLAEPDRRVELQLPDQPRSTHGDAEALRMVVGNLVDNAGKHAPPGTPIPVLVSQPGGLTRVEVADQGDGVPPIDRERIFAPVEGCPLRREPPGRPRRPKGMKHTKLLQPLAGLLLVGLLAAACAEAGGGDAGAGQGATTAPTTAPATTGPVPTTEPAPPAGEVTVTGTVSEGVEPGCLLLDGYLLVGGDRDQLRPGARVAVTGRVDRGLLSTCQQGVPLVVASVEPAP